MKAELEVGVQGSPRVGCRSDKAREVKLSMGLKGFRIGPVK